jgi:NAD(P)-dependent dehydrogenase (short-subunit alcohol dehydrogenase family)
MTQVSRPPAAARGVEHVADPVVIVTGAAGGIGLAVVSEFVRNGWNVLATDLMDQARTDTAYGAVRYVAADVTDPDHMTAVVRTAGELGTLVGCIANAGVTAEDFTAFADAARDHWRRTFDVNVLGVLTTFQAAAAALVRGGSGGRLAATSSVAGLRAEPLLPAYSASKAAVISIVKSLALELGPAGITVNAVAPGPVSGEHQNRVIEQRRESGIRGTAENAAGRFERHRNEGRPIGRLATPQEVAGAFSWLLSDAAAYITGQVLVVDGGGTLA